MENLNEMKSEIEKKINFAEIFQVDKVTPDILKEAVSNLKDNKSDPIYSFSSDCLKHGPEKLFELLATSIKCCLIHGHMTTFLLLATLIPLIKDKLGSINSSMNYRSIALSSQVLKIIDWIILILYCETLGLDEVQFAYQLGTSNTLHKWRFIMTVSYFMWKGSS